MEDEVIQEEKTRLLGPSTREARPFPIYSPFLFLPIGLVSLAEHLSPWSPSFALVVFTTLVGVVGAIAAAGWLEDELYRRMSARRLVWRLLVASVLPFAILLVMALSLGLLSRPLDWLGLGFAAGIVVTAGGLWAASAAVGSLLVCLIDSAVSAVVRDFRSRILCAVMGLLAAATVVSWLAMKMVVGLITGVERGEVLGEVNFTTGEPEAGVPASEFFAGDPGGLAGMFFFVGVVMMVPAALSVAGKLADSVMARIEPLSAGFEAVGMGDRAVRLEEAGSIELVRMARRFNTMVVDLELGERLERAFGVYVSPQIMSRIKERHGEARIPPELRAATVLFLDIRGFTSMSERLPPGTVASVLNRYFDRVVEVVGEHDGYLDKFIGDAVIAVWNGPVDQPDHPRMAADCALALQEATEEMNLTGAFPECGSIGVGIGVATGQVFCGNVGGEGQMEYTVIGDTVNLASRLTSQAPAKEVWISPSTAEALGDDVEVVPLQPLHMKGKKDPVRPMRISPKPEPAREEAGS